MPRFTARAVIVERQIHIVELDADDLTEAEAMLRNGEFDQLTIPTSDEYEMELERVIEIEEDQIGYPDDDDSWPDPEDDMDWPEDDDHLGSW